MVLSVCFALRSGQPLKMVCVCATAPPANASDAPDAPNAPVNGAWRSALRSGCVPHRAQREREFDRVKGAALTSTDALGVADAPSALALVFRPESALIDLQGTAGTSLVPFA